MTTRDTGDPFNFGGSLGTGSFQIMGILNSMKTGDIFVDMIIAMCLPLLLKTIFTWFSKLETTLNLQHKFNLWFGVTSVKYYERFITQTLLVDASGRHINLMVNTQNHVLLRAINLYLDQVAKLELQTAYVDLAETQKKQVQSVYGTTQYALLKGYEITQRFPPGYWYSLGTFGEDKGRVLLKISHENVADAANGDDNGNRRSGTSSEPAGKGTKTTTFHFKSETKGACDAFVAAAYQWYLEELRANEPSSSRWFYEMKYKKSFVGGSNCEGEGSDNAAFKRYLLSDEKTFSNLFFPEKDNLLTLVDHFTKKTGKYSIPGYPYKVGILLHGPPGTGKTSLIKALAQYTGRSIVNVPLTQINTNSELMSIVYDRHFRLDGINMQVNLQFEDVIFVMEDVDAASDVVKRRDGKIDSGEFNVKDSVDLPAPKSMFRMLMESPASECRALVKDLTKRSDRLQDAAELLRPEILRTIARRVTAMPGLGLVTEVEKNATVTKICNQALKSSSDLSVQCTKLEKLLVDHAKQLQPVVAACDELHDAFVDEMLGEVTTLSCTLSPSCLSSICTVETTENPLSFDDPSMSPDHYRMNMGMKGEEKWGKGESNKDGYSLFLRPDPDKLSLAGILNVLDGVVDSPGRIIIMTTNHPEKLDPALVRPGRIDKKILLGHMTARDIVSMLEHFFLTDVSPSQASRVEIAIRDGLELTPAKVEQLAAEYETIEEMVTAMELIGQRGRIQFKQ